MLYLVMTKLVLLLLCTTDFIGVVCYDSYISHEYSVPCFEKYIPENCNYPNITLDAIRTVTDLDRCGPAALEIRPRNLYWAAAGRKFTYRRNFKSLERITIIPKILQDASQNTTFTTLLGNTVAVPIGISPTAAHKVPHPDGEIGSAKAAASHGAVFIFSVMSQTTLEDVANAVFSVNKQALLWVHVYLYSNRSYLQDYLQRAKDAAYKAVVVTVDHPVLTLLSCNATSIYKEWKYAELNSLNSEYSSSLENLSWLVRTIGLPVIAKGIMTAEAALQVARAGVSAILVSNQGGRLIDGGQSTVEVLPSIVKALNVRYNDIEIYIDGGIRSGSDVFKVLALGAKAAFVGRPVIWGLAIDGERGVSKMFHIMKEEFKETMLLSGYEKPSDIGREAVSLPSENTGWDCIK